MKKIYICAQKKQKRETFKNEKTEKNLFERLFGIFVKIFAALYELGTKMNPKRK